MSTLLIYTSISIRQMYIYDKDIYCDSLTWICEKVSQAAFSQMIDFLSVSTALKRFLLYVRRSEIRGVDIENPYMNVMTALTVPDIDDVTVVDYDAQEERIYWADIKTQTIKRAFINGTQIETIISAGRCSSDTIMCLSYYSVCVILILSIEGLNTVLSEKAIPPLSLSFLFFGLGSFY